MLRTCSNDASLASSLTVSKHNGLSDNVQQCSTVFLLVEQEKAHSCLCLRQRYLSVGLWQLRHVDGVICS